MSAVIRRQVVQLHDSITEQCRIHRLDELIHPVEAAGAAASAIRGRRLIERPIYACCDVDDDLSTIHKAS